MDNSNQGYNSGVVLMDIEKLRHSTVYKTITSKSYVQFLCSKYSFVVSDRKFVASLSLILNFSSLIQF